MIPVNRITANGQYIGQPEQLTAGIVARSWGAIGTPRVRISIRIGFALSHASLVQIRSKTAVHPFLNTFFS